MGMKQITDSDDAVVGIITAILLIGLAIGFITMIQTVYVPQWAKQAEFEHMQEVANQFAQLKYAIDIQSVAEQSDIVSTPISLGNSGIPVFDVGKTFGSLEILFDSCNVTVANNTNSFSYSLGTIKYSSDNSYFADQSYIYESGALILSQYPANIMNGKPSFSIINRTNMSFTIVNISGIDGKTYASGYGNYPIATGFLSSNATVITDVTSINITTVYQNAWNIFFNSTLVNSGLTYMINSTDDGITVEFSGSLGNLSIKVMEICAEIAPGWIE